MTADSVNSFKGHFDKCCYHLRFSTDVDDFWLKLRSVNRPLAYTRLLIWWWWW